MMTNSLYAAFSTDYKQRVEGDLNVQNKAMEEHQLKNENMHQRVCRAQDLPGIYPVRMVNVCIHLNFCLLFCSAQKDARFMVGPCAFTVLKVEQLLSNLSRVEARDVNNIFTEIGVQVLAELASNKNWKAADLSDSLRQALLLDKVKFLGTL